MAKTRVRKTKKYPTISRTIGSPKRSSTRTTAKKSAMRKTFLTKGGRTARKLRESLKR